MKVKFVLATEKLLGKMDFINLILEMLLKANLLITLKAKYKDIMYIDGKQERKKIIEKRFNYFKKFNIIGINKYHFIFLIVYI